MGANKLYYFGNATYFVKDGRPIRTTRARVGTVGRISENITLRKLKITTNNYLLQYAKRTENGADNTPTNNR